MDKIAFCVKFTLGGIGIVAFLTLQALAAIVGG